MDEVEFVSEYFEKENKKGEIRWKIWNKLQKLEQTDAKRRDRRRVCEESGKYHIDFHEGREIQKSIHEYIGILDEIGLLQEELLLLKGEQVERMPLLSFEDIMDLQKEFGRVEVKVEKKTKERQIYEDIWKGRLRLPPLERTAGTQNQEKGPWDESKSAPLTLEMVQKIFKEQLSASSSTTTPTPTNAWTLNQEKVSFPPAPWDERKFVPLTHEMLQKFFEEQQSAPSSTTTPTNVILSREEKREKLAAEGRCLDGSYLTPYCMCDGASPSVFKPSYPPIFLAYKRQIRQSHAFDIDDHPCSPFGASVLPLEPHENFRGKAELLMEMANLAILEYNEKECNVFKYKVLKIEKVNYSVTAYFHYWMTVKVLNLTLGSPIETFQIHARMSSLDDDDKVIYCCRPKEEAIVGLRSCDVCFGKLHREEALVL